MVEERIRVGPWDLADFGPNVVFFEVGRRFIEAAEKFDTIIGLDCAAEELSEQLVNGRLAIGREFSWIGLRT